MKNALTRPNGLGKLHPVDYAEQSERASDAYPLILNTGRILYQYHSSTMSRRNKALTDFANDAYVLVNPADATRYGLADQQKVKISSRRGEIDNIAVRVSDEVLPGELFMPFHYSEAPVNRLTRDELDPYSKSLPLSSRLLKLKLEGRDQHPINCYFCRHYK